MTTCTLIRDSEKFIIPHFKMYEGLENYGVMVEDIKGGALEHGKPDRSEELIRKTFPEVKIKKLEGLWEWGSPIFNEMIKWAGEEVAEGIASKVLILHADVLLDKKNFKLLKDFIQNTDYDIYSVDMRKCWINYYGDLDHGVKDCQDVEPVAVKGTTRFKNFYDHLIGEKEVVIDFIEGHHLCGFKGRFQGSWNQSPEAEALAKEYGGWISAPKEIKDMMNESRF